MKIILLRHPQTVANKVGYIYGKMDYPYTPLGALQLKEAVVVAREFSFQTMVTSPIGRAKKLAEAISKDQSIALSESPALEEMGYGIFEGLTVEEAKARYPEAVEAFLSGDEDFDIPQGETNKGFNERVCRFMDHCLSRDEDVLLVSHGGVIRTAIEYLLDTEPGFSWQIDVDNVSFVEIECTDGYHRLKNLRNLLIDEMKE